MNGRMLPLGDYLNCRDHILYEGQHLDDCCQLKMIIVVSVFLGVSMETDRYKPDLNG